MSHAPGWCAKDSCIASAEECLSCVCTENAHIAPCLHNTQSDRVRGEQVGCTSFLFSLPYNMQNSTQYSEGFNCIIILCFAAQPGKIELLQKSKSKKAKSGFPIHNGALSASSTRHRRGNTCHMQGMFTRHISKSQICTSAGFRNTSEYELYREFRCKCQSLAH